MFKFIRNKIWNHKNYAYLMLFKFDKITTEKLKESFPKFKKWIGIKELWDWNVISINNYALFYTGFLTIESDSEVQKFIEELTSKMQNSEIESSKWIKKK